jgi:3-dehydro-L-gulonate 2-dehydrogenase
MTEKTYTGFMVRIPLVELTEGIEAALLRIGIAAPRAALSAQLTAGTDLDGVHTHGIARLPRFAEQVRIGAIDPAAAPERVSSFGAIERWTGHRGPGNLAAHTCMERAVAIARQHGIGAVALSDTSHWMRGGSYGWQAADAGCAAICWTNTLPNLPPWGATTPALGNNPLILAVPRDEEHIVLDIAMSQFSYGALASFRERGEPLPVPGGFDREGKLTTDAAAIEQTQRALPIGFWKGSGLSFVLDILAAMLSGGRTTSQISTDPLLETGISQVFLAIDPTSMSTVEELRTTVEGAIEFLHAATPVSAAKSARYPGENTMKVRRENLAAGVPLDEQQWKAVLQLAK